MHRFRTVFLAVILSLGISLGLLPSAAFAAEDGKWAVRHCVTWDGSGVLDRKKMCAQVRWRNQADGDGVILEFLDVDTEAGTLVFDGYNKVMAKWVDWDSGYVRRTWEWGAEPFNFTKNHDSVFGGDHTSMEYRLNMCDVGGGGGGQDHLWIKWRLFPNGVWALVDKGHGQDSYCN